MMYPSDLKLLNFMKKRQQSENNFVLFDSTYLFCTQTKSVSFVENTNELQTAKPVPKKLTGDFPMLESLKSLEKSGTIKHLTGSLYQVTHDGWNARFVECETFLELVLQGVVCPIVVSVMTTLITMAIKG